VVSTASTSAATAQCPLASTRRGRGRPAAAPPAAASACIQASGSTISAAIGPRRHRAARSSWKVGQLIYRDAPLADGSPTSTAVRQAITLADPAHAFGVRGLDDDQAAVIRLRASAPIKAFTL
jgi:hypothetical protein